MNIPSYITLLGADDVSHHASNAVGRSSCCAGGWPIGLAGAVPFLPSVPGVAAGGWAFVPGGMQTAASNMQSAANSIQLALEQHQSFMDDWLVRYTDAMIAASKEGEK